MLWLKGKCVWVLWGGGLGEQGIKRVEKYQLPLFSKYLPILPAHVDLLLVYLNLNWSKRSVFIESFPLKILRLPLMLFSSFLKMVQKNVGIIVVNLYRDDSLPYLGLINTVGGENVGVGTSQIMYTECKWQLTSLTRERKKSSSKLFFTGYFN